MVLQIAKFQSGVEMGSSSFLPLSVEGYDMRHTIFAKISINQIKMLIHFANNQIYICYSDKPL